MNKLKKIWEWFNGKKTNIGAYAIAVLQVLLLLKVPIPTNIAQAIEIIATVFFLGGASHKVIKSETFNKTLNKIQKQTLNKIK